MAEVLALLGETRAGVKRGKGSEPAAPVSSGRHMRLFEAMGKDGVGHVQLLRRRGRAKAGRLRLLERRGGSGPTMPWPVACGCSRDGEGRDDGAMDGRMRLLERRGGSGPATPWSATCVCSNDDEDRGCGAMAGRRWLLGVTVDCQGPLAPWWWGLEERDR